jgi:hypothetical protein
MRTAASSMSAGAVIVQAKRLSIYGDPFKTSSTRPRPQYDTREWGIIPFASSAENLPGRRQMQAADEKNGVDVPEGLSVPHDTRQEPAVLPGA